MRRGPDRYRSPSYHATALVPAVLPAILATTILVPMTGVVAIAAAAITILLRLAIVDVCPAPAMVVIRPVVRIVEKAAGDHCGAHRDRRRRRGVGGRRPGSSECGRDKRRGRNTGDAEDGRFQYHRVIVPLKARPRAQPILRFVPNRPIVIRLSYANRDLHAT
jgi:hypothetical protein